MTEGETVTFTATPEPADPVAEITETVSYNWTVNGKPNEGHDATLAVDTTGMVGQLRVCCQAVDAEGTTSAWMCSLVKVVPVVEESLKITVTPHEGVELTEVKFTYSAVATGYTPDAYAWEVKEKIGGTYGPLSFTGAGGEKTITLPDVEVDTVYLVRCTTDSAAHVSNEVEITVKAAAPPKIN